MAGRSRKGKKQKRSSSSSSSSSWNPLNCSDTGSDVEYVAMLPKKKAKKELLDNHFKEHDIEDETSPEISSIGTSRRRRRHSKKVQCEQSEMVKDEPSSSENIQSSAVVSEENFRSHSVPRRKRSSRKGNRQVQRRATILSWLIDCDVLQESAEVFVMEEETTTKQGIIRKDGILCSCCYIVLTVSEFYKHAGGTSKKPYEKIFNAETFRSLSSLMVQAWDLPEERSCRKPNIIETKDDATDTYDDACMICADGGDLMCCDECSSTYHQKCLGMKEVPDGSWYCSFCVCKFCGDVAKGNDYLLKCSQCEKKYHWECYRARESKRCDMNNSPSGTFCHHICNEVYDKLKSCMIGAKMDIDTHYTWSLLQNEDDGSGINAEYDYQRTVSHSKLAVARRLMEDCFEKIIDRHTRIDVVRSVIYNCGSNFNRVNFSGFYTAILENKEEIISAASIRIHGTKLAEMPFIATHKDFRKRGMCRKLMVALESALCFLNVEKLVIPSVSECIGIWIEKYGFHLVRSPLPEELKFHNLLMFHDARRLQKNLLSPPLARTYRANSRARESGSSEKKSKEPRPFDLNVEPSQQDQTAS